MGATSRPPWAGESDGLVGRDTVLARLHDLVGEGARTALVVGMPGAGKTAVLAQIGRAAMADGWTVLSVTGHAMDSAIPYAALVDLLSLITGGDALVQASVEDPLRLRLEVLSRLEEQTDDRPVVVLLDDVHWFDRSSLSVLGFVANRLADSRLSLIATARPAEVPADLGEHTLIELPPLTERESSVVLRRAGIDLDAVTRPMVIEQSAGNPLALLELGRAASGSRTAVPSSVEAAYAMKLAAMPAETRRVLLLAACGNGDLRVLGRVIDPDQLVAALSPAELAGLVEVVERTVRFQHPLARSAVLAGATTEQRVHAHRDLADASDDPDRKSWHRAEATIIPDEEVAADLEAAARRAQLKGANFEAARLMARAADLSPLARDRDRRLLDSAGISLPIGQLAWLAEVASRLRAESDDLAVRAQASHYEAYALAQTVRQSTARLALLDALERLLGVDVDTGLASLTTLAALTYGSGEAPDVVAEWLERYESRRSAANEPDTELTVAAKAWVRALTDPLAQPAEVLDLVRLAPQLDPAIYPMDQVASREMLLGAAAWILDEPVAAATRLRRSVDLMRRANTPGQMVQTLLTLAQVQFDTGAYDEVDEAGRLLLDLAEAEHLSYIGDNALTLRARVAGVRGDADAVQRMREEVLLDLEVGECLALESDLRVAMAYVYFAANDPAGVHDQLRGLFRSDGTPVHFHIGYRELAHYVVAAVRADTTADVGRVMEVATARLADAGPRHQFQLARARAALAGDDAEPFFVAATADPIAAQWPFELANAQLEYGAWLRRRHRPTAARGQLQAALEVFERLGARAWTDVTRTELRAAGVTTGQPALSTWTELTAQERQVVRLAASGMTNREIGASLYLSPRTVSAHLYKAFPKLGVTSRSQLRDIVEAQATPPR